MAHKNTTANSPDGRKSAPMEKENLDETDSSIVELPTQSENVPDQPVDITSPAPTEAASDDIITQQAVEESKSDEPKSEHPNVESSPRAKGTKSSPAKSNEDEKSLKQSGVAAGYGNEQSEEEYSIQSQGTTGYSADQSEGDDLSLESSKRRALSVEERTRSRHSTGGYASEQGTDFSSLDHDDEDAAAASKRIVPLAHSPFVSSVASGPFGSGGTSKHQMRRRRFERRRFREERAASRDGQHSRRSHKPGDPEKEEEKAGEAGPDSDSSDTTEDYSDEEKAGGRGRRDRGRAGSWSDGEHTEELVTPTMKNEKTKPAMSCKPDGQRLDFKQGMCLFN